MSIEAIQVVSVPVGDQAAAKRFYVEVLGFEVVRDAPFTPDARWIELSPARGSAAIALVTWFQAAPPGSLPGAAAERVGVYSLRIPSGEMTCTPTFTSGARFVRDGRSGRRVKRLCHSPTRPSFQA